MVLWQDGENATGIGGTLSYQMQAGFRPVEEEDMQLMFPVLALVVVTICVFTFLSVAVFATSRRKEREAYYRSESMRRIAEMSGDSAKGVLEVMAEEQRVQQRNRMERTKIGGLINIAVGLGLLIFFYSVGGKESPYLCGLIPGFIGIAMLVYALVLAPKEV
jgi:hypothetical protein